LLSAILGAINVRFRVILSTAKNDFKKRMKKKKIIKIFTQNGRHKKMSKKIQNSQIKSISVKRLVTAGHRPDIIIILLTSDIQCKSLTQTPFFHHSRH
jgi:hypothetical protein